MAGSQLRKFGKSLIVIVAMTLFACADSGTEAAGAMPSTAMECVWL